MRNYLLLSAYYVLLVAPLAAFAGAPIRVFDTPSDSISFYGLAIKFGAITNAIIPFLIGVAVVCILWGIFKYIVSAGDTEKVAEGRKTVLYGIVALFIMLSFWGFVLIIQRSVF